ncbi:MAG: molecular chaperone DnaK [Bradymonadia bacterium]|jgi:molecular chaperone DnaK
MNGRVVGIDLGTSNSVVCAVVDGEAVVIPDHEGRKIQPSVVSFLPDGRTIVGRQAKSRMAIDPLNTVYSAKRLIGRPFHAPEINLAITKYAYQIVKGDDENPRTFVRGRHYRIEEIQAIILRHMKQLAENYLGEPVTRAVITVPANFNDAQRQTTKTAGEIAGLDVLRILNEPTAAALAYGYEQQLRERIAVYDLGGGTFDITVLELRDNVFEVLATAGDTFLGGDDFDHAVSELIVEEFSRRFEFDMAQAPGAMQRLKAVSERLKTTLTKENVAQADIKQMVPGSNAPSTLDFSLSRQQFDDCATDIIRQTFIVCDEALKLAGMTSGEIDRLVLVGGSTRVPLVRSMVQHYFFKEPLVNINPDEVVAVGAAIYAFGLEEQSSGDFTDESGVYVGANVPLLIDVTPHALGVATTGGFCDAFVDRNSSIPLRTTRSFSTSADDQTQVRIQILEGGSRLAAENRVLGALVLSDIRAAGRGDVRIDVSFEITPDGILMVTARDQDSGQVQDTQLSIAGAAAYDDVSDLLEDDLPELVS